MPTELWLRDPHGARLIQAALQEGITNFTWHTGFMLKSRQEVLSAFRSASMGFSQEVRVMIIDPAGAAEYTVFDRYNAPRAVYPTWTPEESFDELLHLIENPPGENAEWCFDESIQPEMRPVYGQRHRVVIHRITPSDVTDSLLLQLREIQQGWPEVELMICTLRQYSQMYGYGFPAVDWVPICLMTGSPAIVQLTALPTGKSLKEHHLFDERYADWFSLLGFHQSQMVDKQNILQYTLRAAEWARRNWDLAVPFAIERGSRKTFVPDGFHQLSDKSFIIPSARRKLMRNIGLQAGELDKFLCDTCVLQNACSLYREGSVCTVKGADTVSLAEQFGTRSADAIIGGLSKLLQRQAERLETAQAQEDASGELDPDVTRQYNAVFANGVKLAKLIDPSLAGGASVNVNVGVGVSTAGAVGASDPRQLVASVVAELEAAGIPREQITSDMIRGVLESLAGNSKQKAISAAAIVAKEKRNVVNGEVV